MTTLSPSSGQISTRELLVFYYKYRMRLFLAFLLPLLIAVIVSFVPTPRYPASSVLIVRIGSEYVYQPEVSQNQAGPAAVIPFAETEIFKSEVAILNSDDLHAEVIKSIGIEKMYPEMFKKGPLSEITDPIKNAIKNEMVSLGLAERKTPEQIEQARMATAVAQFDKRLDLFLQKESAVIDLTFEHKDPAIAVAALDTLLKLYFEKRKELYLDSRIDPAQAQVDITRQKAEAAATAVETYKRDHKLYSLTDQRAELLAQRGDIEKEMSALTSPALTEKLGFYNHQLDTLDQEERAFNALDHDRQIADDEYALAMHNFGEAKAFDSLERERIGSVRIIQAPMVSPQPKKVQPLIILAGLVVAVVITLMTAAITEFAGSGFLTPERLERSTGLPVLAAVPFRKNLALRNLTVSRNR